MPLEFDQIIKKATCDSCKRRLHSAYKNYDPNYGVLTPSFGYGSPLDLCYSGRFVVCEECWLKALKAIGLDKLE